MRRRTLPIVLAAVAVVALAGAAVTFAFGVTRDDEGASSLSYAQSAGMMDGFGMMGGGMMGGFGPGLRGEIEPVGSLAEAKSRIEEWLATAGFEDFAVGEVMAFSNGFYIAIEDDEGRGAFELLLDPVTGWVSPEPGPNMMWNTEYGMLGGRLGSMMDGGFGGMGAGMMGKAPGSQLAEPLSPEQAQAIANRWLDGVLPGEAAGEPHAFPGYYTFDTERDGLVQGMLSVNAQTGAVWYHVWHGSFLDELEA